MPRDFRELSFGEVEQILAAVKSDEPARQVADRFDIRPATVKTLVRKFADKTPEEIEAAVRPWNKYKKILRAIFEEKFNAQGRTLTDVPYTTDDLARVQNQLELHGGNPYDLKYNTKGRGALAAEIQATASEGKEWRIHQLKKGEYVFRLFNKGEGVFDLDPEPIVVKVPDALPSIVERYSRDDEQALLARIRYNNLVSVFLGIAAYSLQSHWKTSVNGGQVEVDEMYVGLDSNGSHYAVPVEAKGRAPSEKITAEQIISGYRTAKAAFPNAIVVPIAAKVVDDFTFAMVKFDVDAASESVDRVYERHYTLAVNPTESGRSKPILTDEDVVANSLLGESED